MCVNIKGEGPNNWKTRYLKYEYSGITFQDHRRKVWKAQTYQQTSSCRVQFKNVSLNNGFLKSCVHTKGIQSQVTIYTLDLPTINLHLNRQSVNSVDWLICINQKFVDSWPTVNWDVNQVLIKCQLRCQWSVNWVSIEGRSRVSFDVRPWMPLLRRILKAQEVIKAWVLKVLHKL